MSTNNNYLKYRSAQIADILTRNPQKVGAWSELKGEIEQLAKGEVQRFAEGLKIAPEYIEQFTEGSDERAHHGMFNEHIDTHLANYMKEQ